MGTRFDVFLHGDDAEHLEAVAVAVLEEIARLDGAISRFNPGSEVARINREAAQKPVRVDREVFALLERCEQARRLTDGYFDVTASTGGNGLALDARHSTAQFTRPDVLLDLGGIGKGYALDRGREILLRFQVNCGLLQGGTSSVLAVGAPFGANGWPVDVRHPARVNTEPVARVELIDRGFSCSAVRHPDQAESDVVNPLLRQPLAGNAACLALAASAADAEVFSTALLAMGRQRATLYLANHSELDLTVGWFESDCGFVRIRSA